MTEHRREEDNRGVLLKYWQVIVFVIGVIFAAGGIYEFGQGLEGRVCKTELCNADQEKRLTVVEVVVRENLPDIKEALRDYRRDFKRR